MRKWIAIGMVLLSGVVLIVVLMVQSDVRRVQRKFAEQRHQLDQLLSTHASFHAVANRFVSCQVLAKNEAAQVAEQFAIEKDKARASALRHAKTLFCVVDGDMTVLVFFDEEDRMADYALGTQ